MPSTLEKYYKLWVGSAKRIGLIATTIYTIFVFTGTVCLAGSSAFHRYYGLSLEHWKKGYHHPVRSQKYKRHRFFGHSHLRRHKQTFSSFDVLGGYYGSSDSDDNTQINLILPPDKKEENSETKIEARKPLRPHIETVTKGNDDGASSYQTVEPCNTAAHIVEYRAHK